MSVCNSVLWPNECWYYMIILSLSQNLLQYSVMDTYTCLQGLHTFYYLAHHFFFFFDFIQLNFQLCWWICLPEQW